MDSIHIDHCAALPVRATFRVEMSGEIVIRDLSNGDLDLMLKSDLPQGEEEAVLERILVECARQAIRETVQRPDGLRKLVEEEVSNLLLEQIETTARQPAESFLSLTGQTAGEPFQTEDLRDTMSGLVCELLQHMIRGSTREPVLSVTFQPVTPGTVTPGTGAQAPVETLTGTHAGGGESCGNGGNDVTSPQAQRLPATAWQE